MSMIAKEIVYAARTLWKRPGFSLIAILTLALGIGANTAIFSLVNTVLLRSMPVEQPGEVVAMNMRRKDDSLSAMSYPNYRDFRDRNEVLSGLLVYRFVPLSLSRSGATRGGDAAPGGAADLRSGGPVAGTATVSTRDFTAGDCGLSERRVPGIMTARGGAVR